MFIKVRDLVLIFILGVKYRKFLKGGRNFFIFLVFFGCWRNGISFRVDTLGGVDENKKVFVGFVFFFKYLMKDGGNK